MQISIVPQAGSSPFNCRFYTGGRGLHSGHSGCDAQAKAGKFADWICAEDDALCLGQNAKALKWFEPEEALRVMGGTAIRKATQNGAKQIQWLLDGAVSDGEFSKLAQGALLSAY